MISFPQSTASPEVGFPIAIEATDTFNVSLLEHGDLCPRTQKAVAEQHIAAPKCVHHSAEHPQFALSLACVATDS